ncbi:5'-nucleotidase domain-containing protein 2 [Toxocara canis]|uniref:5'-nucleotidase domain-containing protein 2 n=1 Tax=Toxocara canis TaxID=6265 RepID=A0A0B2VF91_TOXCA|nr:5'-nucleotidase domain-containing protein 2 [Toxocara canis]
MDVIGRCMIVAGMGLPGGKRQLCTFAMTAQRLRAMYELAKESALKEPPCSDDVDPRDVFCNNAINLHKISIYGFDYDYTLAVYTRAINKLIYDLSVSRLIQHYKYPRGLLSIPYDPKFAIRGLHYDITNSCLLKIDAFSQIQNGTVFRGRKKLSTDDILNIYGSFALPDAKGRELMQLIDLFSLPWAGLLSTVVQYFDDNAITFDPLCMYQDVASSVRYVHASGAMYRAVSQNLEHYVHKNVGLKEYLSRLIASGKQLFMVTNSPFSFIFCVIIIGYFLSVGVVVMRLRCLFVLLNVEDIIFLLPVYFKGRAPFRSYHEEDDSLSYEKVTSLESGKIYAGGNIAAFSQQTLFQGRRVLYFGDHIYTDLADPMLMLGWNTAAIVPELAREIRLQNHEDYRYTVNWLQYLTFLIEKYQKYADVDSEIKQLIAEWFEERAVLREQVKVMFNPQFGSLFRTFTNMTYFSRRLNRLSDVYTSRLPNMLKYSDDHTFFPRRNALPHEVAIPFRLHFADTSFHT